MKPWLFSVVMLALVPCRAPADIVELQDGTRIEGTILAENPDSIEIQVGANETGTIRRVLIIDSSEIRTWMADAAGRLPESGAGQVTRLGGTAYIDKLISEAQKKIDGLEYDAGIREFGEAADVASRDLEKLDAGERLQMLELKAYALRLQLAALEGKEEMLEDSTEGVEDKLDGMQRDLDRDRRDYENDLEVYREQQEQNRYTQIGSRRRQSELDVRAKDLERRQQSLASLRQRSLTRLQQMQQELAQTTMQIELAEERVDRAEDEVKSAERAARGR